MIWKNHYPAVYKLNYNINMRIAKEGLVTAYEYEQRPKQYLQSSGFLKFI